MSNLDALAWQVQALPLDRSRALSSRFENLPRCIAQSAPMVVPLRRSGHAVLVARAASG